MPSWLEAYSSRDGSHLKTRRGVAIPAGRRLDRTSLVTHARSHSLGSLERFQLDAAFTVPFTSTQSIKAHEPENRCKQENRRMEERKDNWTLAPGSWLFRSYLLSNGRFLLVCENLDSEM